MCNKNVRFPTAYILEDIFSVSITKLLVNLYILCASINTSVT